MKALRTFVLAVMVLAVAPSTGVAAPSADTSERMIAAINSVRADHGLAPLREAPKLDDSAGRFARSVIRSDSFTHGNAYRANGFRTVGEIMSYNRGWSKRTAPAIRNWLNSPGHRALILSRSFHYAGAGTARGRLSGPPTTIWIVHFGAH
jgi:uncharacterized protein YkwD